MNFNYPDFLGAPDRRESADSGAANPDPNMSSPHSNRNPQPFADPLSEFQLPANSNFNLNSNFNQIFNKLSSLEQAQPLNPFAPVKQDAFNLPVELQGGIGTISSRRPSYAAESFTRSTLPTNYNYQHQPPQSSLQPKNLAQYAAVNNYNNYLFDTMNDSFQNFNINANLNDFQSRRPSQIVDFAESKPFDPLAAVATPPPSQNNSNVKLENGLILKDQYIMATPELKKLYEKTTSYFQDVDLSNEILANLHNLLKSPVIIKLITFIKNLNNLTFNHKILCLVVNKNGKFDLLSYPNSSNIFLQKNDLVIVDGDRGKDLVMILEPLVNLNFAILFNFLKKLEHLKSLTILDDSNSNEMLKKKIGGSHSTSLNASTIINNHSNEDNEFIITLPTKQVLRFATPKEIHKISGKFLEEKKAFITCHNKIKELNLQHSLKLINVEYQSDFKKLIFYYFANFKRIDFRNLIKELFKIYKTRIWLCAVLPHENTTLNLLNLTTQNSPQLEPLVNSIPSEYNLSNEQILNFSINEFATMFTPNYFHSKNLKNLVENLKSELDGFFYGFNDKFNEGNLGAGKSSRFNSDLSNFNPLS